MIVRPTTKGAEALAEYLETSGQTLNSFCNAHGVDYTQAHRNLSGARGKRVSIDFASAIEAATHGQVLAEWWCQGTLSREGQYGGEGSSPSIDRSADFDQRAGG